MMQRTRWDTLGAARAQPAPAARRRAPVPRATTRPVSAPRPAATSAPKPAPRPALKPADPHAGYQADTTARPAAAAGVSRGWRLSGPTDYPLMSVKLARRRRGVTAGAIRGPRGGIVPQGVFSSARADMDNVRVRSRLLLGLLAFSLLGLVLLTPTAALAHGELKSSAPAAGSHLSVAPTELRLTFTEATELAVTRIELFGPDSQAVVLGPVTHADGDARRVVVAAIRGALREGTYTVAWQIAGADGHPVRGRFTFMVMPGASGAADPSASGAGTPLPGEAAAGVAAPGQAPLPAAHHDPATMPAGDGFDAESPLYVAIRWLSFTALLVVLGAAAFHVVVLGFLRRVQEPDSPMLAPASARAASFGLWATAALGVAALLRLYAQSYAFHGAQDALDLGLMSTLVARTVWGWGWLLQVAGVAIATVGFLAARRGRRVGWVVATLAAVVLAFTPALSGHAAAVPRLTWLAVLADGAHVIGAGGWLGSLLLVVAVGIPAALRLPEGERGRGAADLINAFSPTALVFAGIAAATGVFAAWLHLDAVSALWQSDYGRTLLIKLGILSVVAGTGAYNWLRVKPALGNVDGAVRIRRSATVELAVGVLVLVATAVLVATPTPMDAAMGSSATAGDEGATMQHTTGGAAAGG